ncbi:protein of unknown function [Maridesulfovibrio hydrothermalis AM13 = DSM 14728]|uniref:Uncharacterized protein n=1 Tax=Maridesulfovibrio hydrothermalis AM13 = DSM 14728 TaxID=1121451 RepID=L0RFC1_9BACT|nr:protein of unknown function [Maridesulfovibrio hydrothermalis AM13 = DSM 14728]
MTGSAFRTCTETHNKAKNGINLSLQSAKLVTTFYDWTFRSIQALFTVILLNKGSLS